MSSKNYLINFAVEFLLKWTIRPHSIHIQNPWKSDISDTFSDHSDDPDHFDISGTSNNTDDSNISHEVS